MSTLTLSSDYHALMCSCLMIKIVDLLVEFVVPQNNVVINYDLVEKKFLFFVYHYFVTSHLQQLLQIEISEYELLSMRAKALSFFVLRRPSHLKRKFPMVKGLDSKDEVIGSSLSATIVHQKS